ncbi:CRISPR system precrRNA processing endoribonuclease RAMP protein Cas6 [bacterium]|nr:CRISPR system precrRNA processing endoribonuclease RAMP protein Cas6 [bacterium]
MVSPQSAAMDVEIPAIPLTVHQLRFTVRVTEPIHFNEFKGSALRGALAGTLNSTFCPQWRAEETDPLHQSLCPVCQLLSLERTDETSGDIRRPYAVRPPLDSATHYAEGASFEFDMLLIGNNLHLLPYLVLAVQGVGETSGIGRRGENRRRGHFTITGIDAVNPLTGEVQPLLTAGGRMVQQPAIPVQHEQVMATAAALLPRLEEEGNRLTIQMRTPLRLIQGGERVQGPRFFPLAKQSVLRLLDLSAQHGGGRPDVHLKDDVYPWIDQVTLVEDRTHWWDLMGYSGRLQRSQVLGGLMGSATYIAPDWGPILPWLIWGGVVGVGKNIVKGCGVIEIYAGSKIV